MAIAVGLAVGKKSKTKVQLTVNTRSVKSKREIAITSRKPEGERLARALQFHCRYQNENQETQ